jgi:hypothetical protein
MKYNLAKIAVITLTFGALAIGLPNTGRAQPSTRTVQVVNATGSPGVLVNVAVALTYLRKQREGQRDVSRHDVPEH